MPIFFTHAGARLDVEDVPLEVYAEIKDKTGLEWWQVVSNPMRHAKAGELLAKACAGISGVDIGVVTPKTLVAAFTVDEDAKTMPDEFTDGIPDPKAGDVPATT
jgi:hypothetical protein